MADITIILVLWIHVVSVIAWLGGVFILKRIIIPSFKRNNNDIIAVILRFSASMTI